MARRPEARLGAACIGALRGAAEREGVRAGLSRERAADARARPFLEGGGVRAAPGDEVRPLARPRDSAAEELAAETAHAMENARCRAMFSADSKEVAKMMRLLPVCGSISVGCAADRPARLATTEMMTRNKISQMNRNTGSGN